MQISIHNKRYGIVRRLHDRRHWTLARVLVFVFALLPLPAVAQGVPTALHISQAMASGPDITLYLEVFDESGALVPAISANQLAATVGEYEASVEGVQPFAESGDGVTYLFLVDISKSITRTQFSNIRGAITDWVAALAPGIGLA